MGDATTRTEKSEPRRLKPETYTRFRFSKRIKHTGPKVSSGWRLFRNALKPLRQNWKFFGGILLVYGILMLVFVRGFEPTFDLTNIKNTLNGIFGGSGAAQFSTGLTLFGVMLSTTGDTNQVAPLYRTILLLLSSLSMVWGLRQVHSSKRSAAVAVKGAFYKSMYPLVPFLLVFVVIALQLLPLLIGASIYGVVMGSGLAVGFLEQAAWTALFVLAAIWSFYMITPSILALVIVTLPDMAPLRALRSARELVRYRRWTVMRKILFLPLISVLILGVVMVPLIMWVTPLAEWSFFVLSIIIIAVVWSYVYTLYRELL